MRVLGYNGGLDGYPARLGSCHDAAAALVVDGVVVAACEEERLSREKHTGRFPRRAIDYCLEAGGLRSLGDVDLVAYYYSYPLMFQAAKLGDNADALGSFERLAWGAALASMRAVNRVAGYDDARSRGVCERAMGQPLGPGRFHALPHHLCHAASAYYGSGFDRAVCLTVDAEGESASMAEVHARDGTLELRRQSYAPNSLGYLYAYLTRYLGFDRHDEYKVMGLAPYGDPSAFRSFFARAVRTLSGGRVLVDPGLVLRLMVRDALVKAPVFYPEALLRGLGPPRRADEPVRQRHMDIAAALQESLEHALLHVLTELRVRSGERNLCLAGGVALNCSANGAIARSGLFERIHVHPAAHDAGTAVGAALLGYHQVLGQPRVPAASTSPYLGPGYDDARVTAAIAGFGARVRASRPADLSDHVARALADGKVVAWYQGRMEWGPRALGNRSILADPRRDEMKDVVNHAVKLREGFRPFAPACLEERADDWFDLRGVGPSPHMLFVVPVRADKQARIPAVTHVDGSARVQTVNAAQNPRFHQLLRAFERHTGVPVLLNTSFNVRGEPIVATPEDALRCFLRTPIDLLVLHDHVIEQPPFARTPRARRARSAVASGRVIEGVIHAV